MCGRYNFHRHIPHDKGPFKFWWTSWLCNLSCEMPPPQGLDPPACKCRVGWCLHTLAKIGWFRWFLQVIHQTINIPHLIIKQPFFQSDDRTGERVNYSELAHIVAVYARALHDSGIEKGKNLSEFATMSSITNFSWISDIYGIPQVAMISWMYLGDVVCMHADKSIEGVYVLLALWKIGGVMTPSRPSHKAGKFSIWAASHENVPVVRSHCHSKGGSMYDTNLFVFLPFFPKSWCYTKRRKDKVKGVTVYTVNTMP